MLTKMLAQMLTRFKGASQGHRWVKLCLKVGQLS